MPDLTPETIAELRRLAEAATPGPWRTEYLMGAGNDLLTAIIAGRATPDDLRVIGSTLAERDGKFVAAASPAVVLALLDERDALAAKVERVRALADEWTYNGEFGWDDGSHVYGPGCEGQALDYAAAKLRRALDVEPQP